jgi:hypothetical protein
MSIEIESKIILWEFNTSDYSYICVTLLTSAIAGKN